MIKCNLCQENKDINQFYKRYKTCKECVKSKQRKRNISDKNKIRSGVKTCNKCKKEHDISLFRVNRNECISCEREFGRIYNKENHIYYQKFYLI